MYNNTTQGRQIGLYQANVGHLLTNLILKLFINIIEQ